MPDLSINTAIIRKTRMVTTLWVCTHLRKEAVQKGILISIRALAGLVVDHTTPQIARKTSRVTVALLTVAKEQEKEKTQKARAKEERPRAKAAKVAARVERKAKAAEKVRKVKVKAKERFSDSTVQSMEEMLEQEEIGMIQVGQKESGMIRAGMKVLGKSKVGNLPNNPKENPKLNKVKMVHMWVLCSISVSTC